MCVNKQPCHMHGLPVLCKHALAHRAPCRRSSAGAFGLCPLMGEAVTPAAKHPWNTEVPPPCPWPWPQLSTAGNGSDRAPPPRIRVGKQNRSSERTQKEVSQSQRVTPRCPWHILPHSSRSGRRCPDPSSGCRSPEPLARHWSEEEPAASTVQLPPELLRQSCRSQPSADAA